MFTAPCFNDETLQRKDIVDTSIIIIGSVICITFGNKDTHHYSRDELIGLYGEPTFIAYAVLLAIGLAYVFSRLRDIHGKLSVGISNRSDIRFQTFAFPALGGLVGAHSVLFAKSVGLKACRLRR